MIETAFERMGSDQYHEPAAELSEKVRTFARLAASLQEEAEAIGWYEQRISLEKDPQAKAIMEDAQGAEFKHFAMALEFLSRRKPKWQAVSQRGPLQEGRHRGTRGSRREGGRKGRLTF